MLRLAGLVCGNSLRFGGVHLYPMRRALPAGWSISLVSAALAALVAVIAFGWSPWASAAVLVGPALVLGCSDARPHVVGSYLVSVMVTALAALQGAFSHQSPIAEVPLAVVFAPVVAGLVAVWSQLLLAARARRWSVVLGVSVAGIVGLLVFQLAAADRAGALREAPELLAVVQPCSAKCSPYRSPAGHARCSSATRNDRIDAVRECDAGGGFLSLRAGGQQTSVFVPRDAPITVWRQSGKLIVAQEGTPVRGLSTDGAVMLTPALEWSPSVPTFTLYVVGGSLLLVGLSLVLVLRSLQKQRRLAAGIVGHVEAGRFFPRDGHLMPVSVAGCHTNGPALMFGALRRVAYRDGGRGPVEVLSGTLRELVSRHQARRFWAFAVALGAVLFAMVSVAADLARLQ